MDEQAQPQDPLTALAGMAASLHEMFLAYQEAGFTRQEALYLIGQTIRASVVAQNPTTEDGQG